MIPANNPNLIPDIIYGWIISDKVDIEQEYVLKPVAYFVSSFKIEI